MQASTRFSRRGCRKGSRAGKRAAGLGVAIRPDTWKRSPGTMQNGGMTELDDIRGLFDPDWYLARNPDVASAGLDPWAHWAEYGRAEGRQPVRCRALEWDMALWRGLEARALAGLELLCEEVTPKHERGVAAWIMARWQASTGNLDRAREYLELFHAAPSARFLIGHAGPDLLTVELALRRGDTGLARRAIASSEAAGATAADLAVARFLLAREKGVGRSALEIAPDLAALHVRPGEGAAFDRITAETVPCEDGPLVSVIVPLFNAERTIETALRGLLAQDWTALEILVVDDASTDGSAARVAAMVEADPRIRLLTMARNGGAYPARNAGLAAAGGAFVTVHDSDDWSHPSKIRLQVEALRAEPAAAASIAHWMRVDEDLMPARWRMEEGWTHRNVSSLMMRIDLRDRLGFWDRVRANADTEYVHRIGAALGPEAIVDVRPGVPLAFGRTTPQSLTMTPATHARTQFSGPRRDYLEAADLWHAEAPQPYMPERPTVRPFSAPEALGPMDPQPPATPFDKVRASAEFDPAWYLETNPDLLQLGLGLHPALHYLRFGAMEGRDPGPRFSSSAYARAHALGDSDVPLLHAIEHGHHGPFVGQEAGEAQDGPRVLVFAHEAGRYVFGAERSFLDILRRLRRDGLCPVVVLPRIVNADYAAHLKPLVASVEILPMKWRFADLPPDPRSLAMIGEMIRRHDARSVHVNTLVLDAPLLAARAAGAETVVHVRELPEEDPGLCEILGTRPEPLRTRLLAQADRFVANSPAVAEWLDCPSRVTVCPNSVPPALFDLPWSPGPRLRVGLVGSLMKKKGVRDFVAVAQACFDAGSEARFLLIGPPDSPDIPRLPPNVELAGYAPDPVAAMEQVDLVLSLSHFAESFGRTVLEAMAAGRPVIVYDRGAPPWIVGEGAGAGGMVVRRDTPEMVARLVLALEAGRSTLARTSEAARARAEDLQAMAEGRA